MRPAIAARRLICTWDKWWRLAAQAELNHLDSHVHLTGCACQVSWWRDRSNNFSFSSLYGPFTRDELPQIATLLACALLKTLRLICIVTGMYFLVRPGSRALFRHCTINSANHPVRQQPHIVHTSCAVCRGGKAVETFRHVDVLNSWLNTNADEHDQVVRLLGFS